MSGMMLPESARNHPYLWSSVACHLLLLSCMLTANWGKADKAAAAQMHMPPTPAMLHAREERLQRQIQTMERIQRMLNETNAPGTSDDTRAAKPPDAKPHQETRVKPEQKARQLAAEIERNLQEDKARELARLLHIPEKAALERVKAERTTSKQLSIDELTQRANEALDFRRRELYQKRDGVKLGANGGAQAARNGPDSQGGAGENAAGGALGLGYDPDSTHTVVEHRNYGAEIGTPLIDASQVRSGYGRIFGAGGSFANRVYLNTWYMIGPFAGVGQESIDNSYPPERMIDLDAVYAGMDGSTLRWHYEQFSQYPLVPIGHTESAVYYGYTEIDMDRDQDVMISMGADDDAKLWVNDQLVWRSGNNVKPWYQVHFKYLKTRIDTLNLNEVTRVVHLNKGKNKLLFKLYNGSGATFISIVLSPS